MRLFEYERQHSHHCILYELVKRWG